MYRNDEKSAWEHHLGVVTIHFGDLGCPGRYYGVLERDFAADSQDPKVGYGGEKIKKIRKKIKSHKTSRNV